MINENINGDCFDILPKIESNSINLILTDPPFNISRKSNYHKHSNNIKFNKISIDFGYWDKDIDFDILFEHYYRVLKPGGTLILFYDIWKCNIIKEIASKYKFKQHRICQWVKSNPVPINSKKNYLSNGIEFFFSFIKDKNPIFNSQYDNGVYTFPICHGKERTEHPTQKPLSLIRELILKHTNENDIVLDTFSGSATTSIACIETKRNYISIEKDETYYNVSYKRLKATRNNDINKKLTT